METKCIIVAPPAPAPPLSWFRMTAEAGLISLACEPRFRDDGTRNRLMLASDKGRLTFSIPLVAATRKGLFQEVEISYREDWPRNLIHTLRTCYGKSPYYEFYDYRIEQILQTRHRLLKDLIVDLLRFCLHCLKKNPVIECRQGILEPEAPFFSDTGIPYYQTFSDKTGFLDGLSILDLIFHEGVEAWRLTETPKV